MTLDPNIFKAYDIRALVPDQVDEDGAYLIGQALVRYTGAKAVVVGHDMRKSSPVLFKGLARGINSQGVDVISVGMVPTPVLYFAVSDYELHDAGVMITASHNPKQWNGFKLCQGDVQPIGANTGMNELKEIALAGPYPEKKFGTIIETDVKETYLDRIFSMVDVSQFKKMKVVIDCGNGVAGVMLKDFLARLSMIKATVLYDKPDGNFPNHEANPLKEETLEDLKAEIAKHKADFGIAYDGDGDRLGLVDDQGEVVRGDITTALLAPTILDKHPGGKIFYDVRSSWAVTEEIEKAGGVPRMGPVGPGVSKPMMKEEKAVFGGEISPHHYFADLDYIESTDLLALMIMELISKSGKSLSELVKPLKRYAHSGEHNFKVEDKQAVLDKIEKEYGQSNKIIKIDGLRIEIRDEKNPDNDWWLGVRVSNTEPLLRLNLECKTKEMMEEKKAELTAMIQG